MNRLMQVEDKHAKWSEVAAWRKAKTPSSPRSNEPRTFNEHYRWDMQLENRSLISKLITAEPVVDASDSIATED